MQNLAAHPFFVWLHSFFPAPIQAGNRERLYGAIGAGIGLLCTEWVSHWVLGGLNPWFVAPMGASAVLLFAVPASPLAQPWSIIGGNTAAAILGVSCALLIDDKGMAAALAVALTIWVMFQLRCLHPPGGAVAITAVWGGPAVSALGYRFAFWPVLLNSALLLGVALIFNNALFRRYPHPHKIHSNPHHTADLPPSQRLGFTSADLDAALNERSELLDISKDDLEEILQAAEARAHQRLHGLICCADIMSRDIISTGADTSLGDAWALLMQHNIAALPVLNPAQQLIGLLSRHDFLSHPAAAKTLDATHTVASLMRAPVITAQADQHIETLVDLFADDGPNHLPVIDDQRRVIGMITPADLIAALYRRT